VSIKVFTSQGDQFWTNSVMIEGVHEVMLVDAQLTKTNAERVLQEIKETHKPLSLIYAASKAALRSFVRTWTTDLKGRRIRSNVVSPGPIKTPLSSRQSADVIARMVSTIPMGRMGEPEDVAKVALFLASDDSSFVTGIELFVDGGRAQV